MSELGRFTPQELKGWKFRFSSNRDMGALTYISVLPGELAETFSNIVSPTVEGECYTRHIVWEQVLDKKSGFWHDVEEALDRNYFVVFFQEGDIPEVSYEAQAFFLNYLRALSSNKERGLGDFCIISSSSEYYMEEDAHMIGRVLEIDTKPQQ